jgi:hypothetical protein
VNRIPTDDTRGALEIIEIIQSPNISQSLVTERRAVCSSIFLLEVRTGNFGLVCVSNERVANHFEITFRAENFVEENVSNYPIS